MAIKLSKEVIDLINKKGSVKILATIDEQGIAQADEKEYLEVTKDGYIRYLELLETARSYKNFTRSLWFNQKISITIIGENKESYKIIGRPDRIYVCGEAYEEQYKRIRNELGDVDLAAICIVEPEEIYDVTLSRNILTQDIEYPIFKHLDRILK